MIKNISLKNFKAFHNEIVFDFYDSPNLLIGGENGSGKSSLFEAIKYVFFYDRLLMENISVTRVGDERDAAILEWRQKYNHRKYKTTDFVIKINGQTIDNFDKSKYLIYMVSGDDIRRNDELLLGNFFRDLYFLDTSVDEIIGDKELLQIIINTVNETLKNVFYESIQLELTQSSDCVCRIIDTERDLNENKSLKTYFNEAKLHIINLLLILSLADACKKEDEKKRILVLDDFITSLDATNRTLIIKFILGKFGSDFQIIMLTHNQSYFNLTKYIVENIFSTMPKWSYQTLYEFRNEHKIYRYEGSDDIKRIRDDYLIEKNKTTPCFESIGNRLRQRFEVLLFELARLAQIGNWEESKLIISNLVDTSNKTMYLLRDGDKQLNSFDLLNDIENTVYRESIPNDRLRDCLKSKIEKYKNKDQLKHLIPIIRDMRIYQKVILHQMSHGRDELPTNSSKEIECTMDLLSKMESVINKKYGVGLNVYTI